MSGSQDAPAGKLAAVLAPYKTRQVLFLRYLWRLLKHAEERGLFLVMSEGPVIAQRKSRGGTVFPDGVHREGSLHYERLAADLMLYDEASGEAVTNGEDPRWVELGEFWEGLDHGLTRWGGRFQDACHFSVTYGGRS